jgi:hypothetical protein
MKDIGHTGCAPTLGHPWCVLKLDGKLNPTAQPGRSIELKTCFELNGTLEYDSITLGSDTVNFTSEGFSPLMQTKKESRPVFSDRLSPFSTTDW